MLRTMTQGYPRFHPYKRVLYHNVDGSSPELKDYHVVAADHGRFLEEIAQLPPLSEQSQPLRLEQHHGQQQKQPEDHGDTASANVGCEHELVVCGQGRVKSQVSL
ncbi:hypothetical protein VKT23_009124 [Stygiomarasmius scandens]|uniref:Uncharacterized protein n=1 Tax=Marasmiellus scandens TaxID=2682957 RepID=A0ABR1JF49_9AGAR